MVHLKASETAILIIFDLELHLRMWSWPPIR